LITKKASFLEDNKVSKSVKTGNVKEQPKRSAVKILSDNSWLKNTIKINENHNMNVNGSSVSSDESLQHKTCSPKPKSAFFMPDNQTEMSSSVGGALEKKTFLYYNEEEKQKENKQFNKVTSKIVNITHKYLQNASRVKSDEKEEKNSMQGKREKQSTNAVGELQKEVSQHTISVSIQQQPDFATEEIFAVSPIANISTDTPNSPVSQRKDNCDGPSSSDFASMKFENRNKGGEIKSSKGIFQEPKKESERTNFDVSTHSNSESILSCTSASSFSSRFKRYPKPGSRQPSLTDSRIRLKTNNVISKKSVPADEKVDTFLLGQEANEETFITMNTTTPNASVSPSETANCNKQASPQSLHNYNQYDKLSLYIPSSTQFQESLIEEEEQQQRDGKGVTVYEEGTQKEKGSEKEDAMSRTANMDKINGRQRSPSVESISIPPQLFTSTKSRETNNIYTNSCPAMAPSKMATPKSGLEKSVPSSAYKETQTTEIGKEKDFLIQEKTKRLIDELKELISDVMEINSMTECMGKPISFFLDIMHSPLLDDIVAVSDILPGEGSSSIAESSTPKSSTAPSVISPLSHSPVENSSFDRLQVVIRATNLTNGSYRLLKPIFFKKLLTDIRKSYTEYRTSSLSRSETDLNKIGGQLATCIKLENLLSGQIGKKEKGTDVFFIPTDSLNLGVCDIYLQDFLENQVDSIQGNYHILDPEDGSIIGRLNSMLSISAKYNSSDKPFKVRFVINELLVAAQYLLLWAGQGYGIKLRGSNESTLPLQLEYSFNGEIGCFEIPDADVQCLPLQVESGIEMQPIRINFQKEFIVENVQDVNYLFYLSNNTLRVNLKLGRDPVEMQLWTRSSKYKPLFPHRFVSSKRVEIPNLTSRSSLGKEYYRDTHSLDHFYPSYKQSDFDQHFNISKPFSSGLKEERSFNCFNKASVESTIAKEDYVENEYIFDQEITSRLNTVSSIRRTKRTFYSSHRDNIFLFINVDVYEPNPDCPQIKNHLLTDPLSSVESISGSERSLHHCHSNSKSHIPGRFFTEEHFYPVDLKTQKKVSLKNIKSTLSTGLDVLSQIACHTTYGSTSEFMGTISSGSSQGIQSKNSNKSIMNDHLRRRFYNPKALSSCSSLPKIDEENEALDLDDVDIIDDGMSDITTGSDEENDDGNTSGTKAKLNNEIAFYLSNDPRIHQRHIHITIEQVEPLSLLIESVAKVTSSEYMLVEAGEDVSDLASLSNQSECQYSSSDNVNSPKTELNILKVVRDLQNRQIKIIVEMPVCHGLYENTEKGLRIALPLQISLYMRGAIIPVTLFRTILMKVCSPDRKSSILRLMNRNLSNDLDTRSRYSKLGSYLSLQRNLAPDLDISVRKFVYKKIHAYYKIQKMRMYVAASQGNTNTELKSRKSLENEIKKIEENILGKTDLVDLKGLGGKSNIPLKEQEEELEKFALTKESKSSSCIQLALFGVAEPTGPFKNGSGHFILKGAEKMNHIYGGDNDSMDSSIYRRQKKSTS